MTVRTVFYKKEKGKKKKVIVVSNNDLCIYMHIYTYIEFILAVLDARTARRNKEKE